MFFANFFLFFSNLCYYYFIFLNTKIYMIFVSFFLFKIPFLPLILKFNSKNKLSLIFNIK